MSVDVKKRWAGASVERRAPIAAFRDALSELMDGDDRVVALCGDLVTRAGLAEIEEQYPGRLINSGAGAQNLLGMAAGMASMGKVVVAVTSGSQLAMAGNLLANVIGHSGLHVVIVGFPAGLTGMDGTAGHTLNDLGLLAAIPAFRVLAPADAEETAKALITLVDDEGPGYLRLSGEEMPAVTGPDTPFDLGEPVLHREGGQVTIIASGPLTYEALCAGDLLEDEGIEARVLAAHSLSPFDPAMILQAAEETRALVVVEEHAPHGGLGAAVARATSAGMPVHTEHLHSGADFVGAGEPSRLRASLGLDAAAIALAAKKAIGSKG